MTHEEIQELLGAYALDAVDDAERAEIDDHLRECVRCRTEVAEHRETAAFLAHAGADAPAALWDDIAAAIAPTDPPDVVPLAPRLGAPSRRNRWPAAMALVGAAAAIVIGLLIVQVRDQDRRIDRIQAASDPFGSAMDAPGSRLAHLTAGDTELPVVLTSDGKAWLRASALPDLPDGRTYQLWGKSGDDLVSVAVLGRRPGVVSFDASGYAALAITEERSPGVVRTQNQPVASGALS
jgi:anti-sigma factor RsiW